MRFTVFEDNSGRYRWTIVAQSGDTLAQSSSFASYEDAAQAAHVVHAGAGSGSFEPLAGDVPATEFAERTTRAVQDDRDAERWLDEGGSFSSEAVPR